jgi:hypothetical protein
MIELTLPRQEPPCGTRPRFGDLRVDQALYLERPIEQSRAALRG